MFLNDELENSPLFYYFLGVVLVMSSLYGIYSLFTGDGQKGIFILTISVPFYPALYFRLFSHGSDSAGS